jgi:hypothetical protein
MDLSQIPPNLLAQGAARGSEVHIYCAAMFEGLYIPVPPSDTAKGYIESCIKWKQQYVKEVVAVELYLEHPEFQYCGTIDLICLLHGDTRPRIVDLKTPKAVGRLWITQVVAYAYMAKANGHDIDVANSGTLRLRENGDMAIFDALEDEHEKSRHFLAFINGVSAYRYFVESR